MKQDKTERSAISSSPLQAKFKKTRRKTALTTISTEDEWRRANGVQELNKVMSDRPHPGRSIHILTGGNVDLTVNVNFKNELVKGILKIRKMSEDNQNSDRTFEDFCRCVLA